jgi:hypothetical protein
MCTEKEFLGRIWRVFHFQDVKKKNSKDNLPSQRLVLFAVDGLRLQKISLYEIINWAIPLNKNGHQGFCKAHARLDLFLSQTIPTVKFTYREVKYVKDTLADGALESEEYNDRRLKFEYRHGTSDDRAVMNDGCSLISVGAAEELCEDLGIKGVRPVPFQGRINGCKGVWMISAPYDTTDPKHLKRWIHMSESQRKVMPRHEDFSNSCEISRWSFKLVKYTHWAVKSPSRICMQLTSQRRRRRLSTSVKSRCLSLNLRNRVRRSSLTLPDEQGLQTLKQFVLIKYYIPPDFPTRGTMLRPYKSSGRIHERPC